MHLFAYGSLMFDEIWSKVVSGRYEKRQARLTGYSRREVAGETYPALVPGSPGDGVHGTVYFDLQPNDMERLDRFEGNQYRRKREVCQLSDGSQITVWVFLFRHEYGNRVTATEWRPEDFAKGGMATFLSGYRGFR